MLPVPRIRKSNCGAADTFRAAAIDQRDLGKPRRRSDDKQEGSDPASVAYDTVASAKAIGPDVVIIDTADVFNKVNP